jgi:tagatose 1,6-diphosphate aldolase
MSVSRNSISTDFAEPGALDDGELRLVLVEQYAGDPARSWAPAYRFEMSVGDTKVGDIELRLGSTDFMVRFGGQVGYGVAEAHRGHRYAARGLRLLVPLARRQGFSCLWITCDPQNLASRRSCEIAGAQFVEIVDLPEDCDMYRRGDRQRCRYRVDC